MAFKKTPKITLATKTGYLETVFKKFCMGGSIARHSKIRGEIRSLTVSNILGVTVGSL